jgi:hypothetical protein
VVDARKLVPAFAGDLAVRDDNRTDKRVVLHLAEAAISELEGSRKVVHASN